MKVQMFTIYDKKMQIHQHPFMAVNRATMMRTLSDSLARNDNMMSRFPSDYEVYLLGEYDELSGKMSPATEREFICNLEELVERTEPCQKPKLST